MPFTSSETSCFQGVAQVPPASYLISTQNNISSKIYWEPSFNNCFNTKNKTEKHLINEFRKKLECAVRRRMVADVPVGCYLSGGLDSTSILALASTINPKIQAFNLAFDHLDFYESPYAQQVATSFNVDLSTVRVSEQDIVDNFEEAVFHREGPVYQTAGVAKFILSKHVRDSGCKVVLTGEGADELLLGYQYFKEDLLLFQSSHLERNLVKLGHENEKTSAAYVSSGKYNALQHVVEYLGYIPASWKLGFDIGSIMQAVYSRDFSDSLKCVDPFADLMRSVPRQDLAYVNQSVLYWLKTFFSENLLTFLGDRSEMAHSVEGRVPFLDPDLADFCLSVPINMRLRGEIEKYMLREAMKGIIPDSIYIRQKHIFAAPPIEIGSSNNVFITFAKDIVLSLDFKRMNIFDSDGVIKMIDNLSLDNKRDFMIKEFCINLILSTFFVNKHFHNNRAF